MLALGIDLADAVTIGVAVDDAGKVLRQGRGTGSPSGIRTLLDELAAGHKPDAVGVAADSAGAGIRCRGRLAAPASLHARAPPLSSPNRGSAPPAALATSCACWLAIASPRGSC